MARRVALIVVLALIITAPGCASPFHTAARSEPELQASEPQVTDKPIDWDEVRTSTGECLERCVTAPFVFVVTCLSVLTGHGFVPI